MNDGSEKEKRKNKMLQLGTRMTLSKILSFFCFIAVCFSLALGIKWFGERRYQRGLNDGIIKATPLYLSITKEGSVRVYSKQQCSICEIFPENKIQSEDRTLEPVEKYGLSHFLPMAIKE